MEIPAQMGKLSNVRLHTITGRYEATCTCGRVVSLSYRDVFMRRVKECPECAAGRQPFQVQAGDRWGAVVILRVLSPDRVVVRCDRCFFEGEVPFRAIRTRYRFMEGETDCGCSKAERDKEQRAAVIQRKADRKVIKAHRQKALADKRAAASLAGKKIGKWIIVRQVRRPKSLSTAGRYWEAMCTCGSPLTHIHTSNYYRTHLEGCAVCRPPRKRAKAIPVHSPRTKKPFQVVGVIR